MSQVLRTAGRAAYFNFLENFIYLERLKFEDIARVLGWYRDRTIFEKGGVDALYARRDKADLVHEATHFLDATTTFWGLEYNHRKGRLSAMLREESGQKSAAVQQALEVFMISSAEIDMHHARIEIAKGSAKLTDCTMVHELLQDDQFGPLIRIQFKYQDSVIQKAPLTMLSLLEANATANEIISYITDAEMLLDPVERSRALAGIEASYAGLMLQSKNIEYTLLLHLFNRGFSELALKDRLRLVSALVRMVLNFDMFRMSQMASELNSTFLNGPAGMAISMDMARGSSRVVIAFKIILWLDGHLVSCSAEERRSTLSKLRDDPFGGLESIMVEKGLLPSLNDLEMAAALKWFESDTGTLDHIIIPRSVALNREILVTRAVGEAFFELSIVDPVLIGDSSLKLPRRIDLDVKKISSAVSGNLKRLSRHYIKSKPSKFFMKF